MKVYDNTRKAQSGPVPQPSADLPQLQRRLSNAEAHDLVTLYRAGAGIVELSRHFGVHYSTISRQLDQAGVPKRVPGLQPEQIPDVVRLYVEDKLSLAELGRKYRVNGKTVAATLRNLGIPVRGRGRPTA